MACSHPIGGEIFDPKFSSLVGFACSLIDGSFRRPTSQCGDNFSTW